MAKKGVSLAVGRGEKLPVSKGAGLTAKGRAKYNAATGSNLKAPQPEGGARKKSFCARMSGMPGPMKDEKGRPTRKAASLKRWKCCMFSCPMRQAMCAMAPRAKLCLATRCSCAANTAM